MEFNPSTEIIKERVPGPTGRVAQYGGIAMMGSQAHEKITGEEIRKKIEDPKDPIHREIRRAVASFVSRNSTINGDYPTTVEDLTQEVSLNVWRHADDFKGQSALNGWIYRIAKNLFLDFLRKNKTRRRRGGTDSLEQINECQPGTVPSSSLSPTEEQIIHRLDGENLLKSVEEKLTIDEIAFLRMKFDEELSVEEIATRLAIPEGTVKSKLFRLLERIRNIEELQKSK